MKITIKKINCNNIIEANVYINNSTDSENVRKFVKINENDYAIGDDGCIYQVCTKDDIDNLDTVILAFEGEGVYFNYAEDELDVEGTLENIKDVNSCFSEISEKEFEELTEKSNYSYDSDDETVSFNQFINIIIDKLCYEYSFSDLCYFCGMRKKFNDLDTRYNPHYSATEYVPHTIYYFF